MSLREEVVAIVVHQPHEYQEYATEFILTHPVAAILLSMGLGKTVITLTAIRELCLNRFETRRVLLIAPLRVTAVWPAEIEKWDHLKGLTYSVAVGTEAECRAALMRDTVIHIINRENVQWLVEKSGAALDYDMIVIDELSSFKTHDTKRFKALMKLRPKVKRIVGLTGTPSSNGLMDLWAEFRLLDLGKRLGRYITAYREQYFLPDKRNAVQVFTYKPRPGAEEEIYRRISDITISMKSVDHLKMPEMIMNTVPVMLSENEREVYDTMRKDMIANLGDTEIDAVNAASLSNKLSQMANGAIYDEERNVHHIHDRKLDALEDLIEAANGKPVLVAYWFKHDLARIQKRFDVREIKTGADITDWNAGRIPVEVIHPASAGHGLNLQAGGSTLIWFGLTFMGRAYRIGVRIRLKEEQLAQIREHMTHITGSYGSEQVSHSRNVSAFDDNLIRIMEHEESLKRKIAELCAVRDETYAVLDLIDDRVYRILLESRYVNGDRWEKTAAACGLSVRQAQRQESPALCTVETVLKTREANGNA